MGRGAQDYEMLRLLTIKGGDDHRTQTLVPARPWRMIDESHQDSVVEAFCRCPFKRPPMVAAVDVHTGPSMPGKYSPALVSV